MTFVCLHDFHHFHLVYKGPGYLLREEARKIGRLPPAGMTLDMVPTSLAGWMVDKPILLTSQLQFCSSPQSTSTVAPFKPPVLLPQCGGIAYHRKSLCHISRHHLDSFRHSIFSTVLTSHQCQNIRRGQRPRDKSKSMVSPPPKKISKIKINKGGNMCQLHHLHPDHLLRSSSSHLWRSVLRIAELSWLQGSTFHCGGEVTLTLKEKKESSCAFFCKKPGGRKSSTQMI